MNSDFNNKRECPIVSLHLIRDAIETASDEWIQYLDIETMEIVRLPEYPFAGEYDEEEQALADLIEEKWQIRFFRLPSKLDIHEYSIMEKFIWSLPEGKMQDSLENAIRGKGAFRRFKDGIYRFGIEQQWYDFQENKYRTLAIEWCENHNFAYHESSPMTAAVVSENAIKQPTPAADTAAAASMQRDTTIAAASAPGSTAENRNAGYSVRSSGDEKNAAENLAWEEIRTEHIIQDEWIDFRRSAYRFPDGSVFEPYYSYSRRDYVVIVAQDEEGRYLCVRQFRQGIREVTTEFPAGGIERTDGREYSVGRNGAAAEDALEAAKRELLEETGYVSAEWKHLLTVPSNATIADNYAHIYAAGNCRKAGGQHLDETEFLHVKQYTAKEIETLISNGNFQQAVHILTWLLTQRR